MISTKYLNELLVLTLSARMSQRSDRQSWLEPWRPLEPAPSFVTAQEGLIVMTESLFSHKQRGYLKVRVIIKTMISQDDYSHIDIIPHGDAKNNTKMCRCNLQRAKHFQMLLL